MQTYVIATNDPLTVDQSQILKELFNIDVESGVERFQAELSDLQVSLLIGNSWIKHIEPLASRHKC